MITNIKQFKESIHWKPSNIAQRSQHLVDNWTKILSQEQIEGDIRLDQWALKVDPSKVKVRKINGHLDISNLGLTEIPEWIGQIEEVNGWFSCGGNQLTTLKNSPQQINGDFLCYVNKLTSLEGMSKWIGKNFSCQYNPKEFTPDDIPKDVTIGGQIEFK